jgi:hypothetical protein
MNVLIEEQSVEHFNLERAQNVHLEVNIDDQIKICCCILSENVRLGWKKNVVLCWYLIVQFSSQFVAQNFVYFHQGQCYKNIFSSSMTLLKIG